MPVSHQRFLAIESSTDTLSVGLGSGAPGEPPLLFSGPGAAQSSATLLPAVQSLLAQAGWSLGSLDAVVFGRGPGSFTGLRTACAVAQGLAHGAGGRPVLPVDTLLALAEAARMARRAEGQTVPPMTAALLDARMDEVYVALYAHMGGAIQTTPMAGPQLCATADVARWLARVLPAGFAPGRECLLAGNLFQAGADRLGALAGPRQTVLPTAEALLALAPRLLAAGHAVRARDALPLYVRDKVALTTLERESQRAGW